MLYEMSKLFKDMEKEALQAGAFIDFEVAAAAKGYGAVKCTVTAKDGVKRFVRTAEDANVSAAQEHAGIMALCALLDKEIPKARVQEAEVATQAAAQKAVAGTGAGTRPAQTAPAGQAATANTAAAQRAQQPAQQNAQQPTQQAAPKTAQAAPQGTATQNVGQRPMPQQAQAQSQRPQPQQQATQRPAQRQGQAEQQRPAPNTQAPQAAAQRPMPQGQAQSAQPPQAYQGSAQSQRQAAAQQRPAPQQQAVPRQAATQQAVSRQVAAQEPAQGLHAADDFIVTLGKYKDHYISDIAKTNDGLKFIKFALNIKNTGANQAYSECVADIKAYVANRPELKAAIDRLATAG